jgi:hypothetical protein
LNHYQILKFASECYGDTGLEKVLEAGFDPNVDNGKFLIEVAKPYHGSLIEVLARYGGNFSMNDGELLVEALRNKEWGTAHRLVVEGKVDPSINHCQALKEVIGNGMEQLFTAMLDLGARPSSEDCKAMWAKAHKFAVAHPYYTREYDTYHTLEYKIGSYHQHTFGEDIWSSCSYENYILNNEGG